MHNLNELLVQQEQIAAQIREVRESQKAEVVKYLREQMLAYEISVKDLAPSKKGKTVSKVAPKYRNPETGETWTGRGRQPKWLAESGIALEHFLIEKPATE